MRPALSKGSLTRSTPVCDGLGSWHGQVALRPSRLLERTLDMLQSVDALAVAHRGLGPSDVEMASIGNAHEQLDVRRMVEDVLDGREHALLDPYAQVGGSRKEICPVNSRSSSIRGLYVCMGVGRQDVPTEGAPN